MTSANDNLSLDDLEIEILIAQFRALCLLKKAEKIAEGFKNVPQEVTEQTDQKEQAK